MLNESRKVCKSQHKAVTYINGRVLRYKRASRKNFIRAFQKVDLFLN